MPGPYYIKGSDSTSTNLNSFGSGKIAGTSTAATNTNKEFVLKNKTSSIDVVNDFVWTASNITGSKSTIPVLYATELSQIQNSLIASALYYLNAVSSGAASVTSNMKDYLTSLLGSNEGLGNDLATGTVNALNSFKSQVEGLVSGSGDTSMLKSYLKSYIGIYLTKPTGFKYAFPFFSGTPHKISTQWQDTAQVKPAVLGSVIEKGMEFIDTAAATLNALQPGSYIEKPKYYHYPTEGETISIDFPLINTIKKSTKLPYQQNYELLWLLAYQNKPFRTSFSRILPPKLYTVSIPGYKYFPFAYISRLDVDFLGTRRLLPVNTPKGEITTSVPEAYKVSIDFTSLLADTGNLMITEGFKSPVNVSTR